MFNVTIIFSKQTLCCLFQIQICAYRFEIERIRNPAALFHYKYGTTVLCV